MRKKNMLKKEEINSLATIYDRIEDALKDSPYNTMAELDRAINEERGSSPGQSLFSRLSQGRLKKSETFHNITAENLFVIADKLNVTTDYLLGFQRRIPAEEIDFSTFQVLGLSEKSAKILYELNNKARDYDPQKIKSPSRFFKNPYGKIFAALNWIIQHIDTNPDDSTTDEYDFLTTVYHLVMLNFPDYKGALLDAILDNAKSDTFSEWKAYFESLANLNDNNVSFDHTMACQDLERARLKLAKMNNRRINERRTMEDLKHGIITLSDPVTYDNVRITLADPKEVFSKRLIAILQNWNSEFQPIYGRKQAQQKDEYDKWFEEASSLDWHAVSDTNESNSDDDVPEALLYRRPSLHSLSEEEMKFYMLLEYLEASDFALVKIEDNGMVRLANWENLSADAIQAFIKQAEADGVGLFYKEGNLFYSSELAQSTRERNEKLFLQHNLPWHLAKILENPTNSTITTNGYYDPNFCYADFSAEEAKQIISLAREKGYAWIIRGSFLDITKTK